MAEQHKPQSTPHPEKQRPRGKTGRGDTFRDSEQARQAEEGGEEWHETGEEGSARR